ncbi:uncharacterized protein LOC143925739 [Lithobates pipiens]
MARISALAVLFFISGILLSNHCINGEEGNPNDSPKITTLFFETTTEAGVVATDTLICPSYIESGLHICSTYVGLDDLVNLLASPNYDVCGTSFQHYACVDLSSVEDNTIYNILNCFITNPDAILTQGAFSLFFSKLSLGTIGFVLNKINRMIPSSSITSHSRTYVLTAVWEKLRQDPENLTPGSLSIWIRDRLYAFLPAINTEILNCLTTTTVTCDGLEAIVQGLDLQYSSLSNETQDEIGIWITTFIKAKSCIKDTLGNSINVYYAYFKSNMNFEDFQVGFGNQNWNSAISSFTEIQLQQYVESTNAFSSQESSTVVINLLNSNDFTYNFGFLSSLPESNYDVNVLFSLLNNLLDKLNNIQDPLCKPQLTAIFQGKLSYLLVATNEQILKKLVITDCSDFQAIYQGYDKVYDQLSDDIKQLVFQYRMKFLDAEAAKSGSVVLSLGSACTYGLNSVNWLVQNLGKSVEYASYADLIRLNLNFDGYQAVTYLNINQTIDMFIHTNIFTSASPIDIESRVTSVTDAWVAKGYTYIRLLLVELRTVLIRLNIRIIINYQVRFLFLEGIWGIIKTHFHEYQSNDWYSFTESMSYFTSAISTEQLSDLSVNVVEDCSNLKIIVGGFGSGYREMNDNSISGVTNWISNFLRNESSHCTNGVADWLADNYLEFKHDVSVAVILEINPDYNVSDSIDILVPDQLGQFIVLDSKAHTDVTIVEKVFTVLTNGTHEENVENLSNFWDAFVSEYEQVKTFTDEVRHYMLSETVSELSTSFVDFTSDETTLWFETRLYPVLPVIDTEVLKEIPVEVGCGFQTSFIQAVSFVYTDTQDTNRKDIIDHIQNYMRNDKTNKPEAERCTKQETSTVIYIQNYYGDYSVDITYEELRTYFINFDVFQSGVFQLLTTDQFGDMFVLENVYESDVEVNQVFTYLQTQTIETVDAVMTRFSETGYTRNIQINTSIGQQILQRYINIIKTQVTTYNRTQIEILFTYRISILIQFFTRETLSVFVIRDCDTLSVIVTQLNKGFSSMTDSTRTEIAKWIIGNLKSLSLNGCTSTYTTTVEWTNSTLSSFFMYTTLKQVQEINHQLDVLQIITETSVSQKVEYLCTTNVLTNVNVTLTVLESLEGEDGVTSAHEVVTFLGDFNVAYEQLNDKTMTTEVRQEAMTYLFESYTSDLNSLTTEQISSFKETFQYFIGGLTSEVVQQISVTIDCDSYDSILNGISSGFDEFSEDVISAVFDWILRYLDYHRSSGGCSSLYTDSRSYIQVIFQSFASKATIYEYQYYYNKFNAYTCLDLFSGTQLGNLLANTTAITDQLDAALILAEVRDRDIETVTSFMTEVNVVCQQKNLTQLPDSNIQNLIFTTVWSTVTESITTSAEYELWFGDLFSYVISSSTASDIASLKSDGSCDSQISVVGGLSKAYSKLGDDQKEAMYNRIRSFNHDVLSTTDSACSTETGSSSEWVEKLWGEFKAQASLDDFKAGNPKFEASSALDVCTGSQVAEYAIANGALNSEEAIAPVLDSIDTPNKVKDFLDQCNSQAPEQLQNSPVGDLILNKTFEILTPIINNFQPSDWQEWTQVTLQNVLHKVDDTELEKIKYPLTCASYQQLLTGLNKVFDSMSEDSRQSVYHNCIQPQFESVLPTSGVKCGSATDNVEVWIQNNFGSFSSYIEISEYIAWNTHYNAVNDITNLSPNQLADVAISAVNDEDVSCQVAARVRKFDVSEVNGFLNSLSVTLQQKNINLVSNVVGSDFLSASLSIISSSLSSYSSSNWEDLVTVRLQPLLFSINSNQLSTLLGSADCDAYKIILQQLNANFDSFTPDNRQSLFGVLYDYIRSKKTNSGFCPQSGDDSTAAITNSIGKFVSYLTYSQLKEIYPSFSWVSAVSTLSTSQLASVTLNENVFTDQDQANAVIGRLEQMSFTDIDAYLNALQITAQQKNYVSIPGGEISQSIFSAIFAKVSAQFTSFTSIQWSNYFGSGSALFRLFFPFFQVSQINLIPASIDCTSFQSVISGFSSSYAQLQGEVQVAGYNHFKSILLGKKQLTGPACPISGNSGKWLVLNFGEIRAQASIADIFAINPDFIVTDAVSYLSAQQLGSYVANSHVWSDQNQINIIFSALNSQTIGSFLDSFNAAAKENGIPSISSAAVRKNFLGEIFCKVGSGFSSFTSANYGDFFENKLQLFSSSLDARSFSYIPTDIGCDSLAAIMQPLLDLTNPENPSAVFDFVNSVLSNTGSACVGDLDTRSWVLKYWGQYLKSGSWSVIVSLYSNFDVAACADLLSSTQLSEAASGSIVMQNITVFTSVIVTFNGNVTALSEFIDTLRQYIALDPALLSNTKVKDTVLDAVAQTVLIQFDTYTVAQVQEWMTRITFLLPSFNATFLEYIPLTIDCPQFQAFVHGMDAVYSSLTLVKQQAVANFIQQVLSTKKYSSEDPCTLGTSSTVQWVAQNIGQYCSLLSTDSIKEIYPAVDTVSYETYCKLS